MIDHRKGFDDFVRYELAVGGPDPHMRVAEYIARYNTDRPAWFAALYTAPYNVPTAEVLYQSWGSASGVLGAPEECREWIKDHWSGLALRKERRVAGFGPDRLATHIIGLAAWFGTNWDALQAADTFEEAFELLRLVPYNGRYFTMKLYQVLHRTIGLPAPKFTDIRPKGGSLARRTLALLYPDHDPHDDSPSGLAQANSLAAAEIQRNPDLDYFTCEVMLCNYRQAVAGGQYPGRAHDSELGHLYRVSKANPDVTFYTIPARSHLFPEAALGEVQGWSDRRKELGRVLQNYGYTWCDLEYDYLATEDLAHPVRRAA